MYADIQSRSKPCRGVVTSFVYSRAAETRAVEPASDNTNPHSNEICPEWAQAAAFLPRFVLQRSQLFISRLKCYDGWLLHTKAILSVSSGSL